MFEVDRALAKTEDFLRRHIKSKAVREAEKRVRQRKAEEAGRRLGRAAALAGASGAGVAVYAVALAPLSAPVLAVAGGAILMAAAGSMFLPSGRWSASRRALSTAELLALAGDTEEWLIAQRPLIPGRALPKLDTILAHLHDIQPHLEGIFPNGTLAWELRRLLANHLPRLIQAYCELPALARERDEERERLIKGLDTIGEELARLCLEASRERLFDFETQGRFLDIRYRDGELGDEDVLEKGTGAAPRDKRRP